jgi:hypothetical protein
LVPEQQGDHAERLLSRQFLNWAAIDCVLAPIAKVRLSAEEMRTEFVCIPRPITRAERPDGGPLRYRVVHSAALWKAGERPVLRRQVIEGDPGLS